MGEIPVWVAILPAIGAGFALAAYNAERGAAKYWRRRANETREYAAENRAAADAWHRHQMLRRMRDNRRRTRKKPDPILSAAIQNTGSCDETRGGCA